METEQAKSVLRRAFLKSKERGILKGHEGVVWKVHGPDGRVFTISEDGTVRIWDPEIKRELKTLESWGSSACIRDQFRRRLARNRRVQR